MKTVEKAYEIDKISESLDWINLMSYDFHGSWESVTGHNAPLWRRPDDDEKNKKLNIEYVVNHWLNSGAPKEKLVMGLATYGRTFRLGKASKSSPGDPAVGPGEHGRFSAESGFFTYYEICKKINEDGWFMRYDRVQESAYAYKGEQWVSFDDIKTLKLKAEYLKELNLGGVMFWSLDTDDFNGEFCGQGKYPLIKSVLSVLSGNSSQENSFTETPVDTIEVEQAKYTTRKSAKKNRLSKEEIETLCFNGDGFYPDYESNCNQYYVCLFTEQNTEHANIRYLNCPGNLQFDMKLKACNFPGQVECQKTSAKKIERKTTKSPEKALRVCPHGDALYLIENSNCKKYYMCAFSGTAYETTYDFRCPGKQLFNVETQKCVTDYKCKPTELVLEEFNFHFN